MATNATTPPKAPTAAEAAVPVLVTFGPVFMIQGELGTGVARPWTANAAGYAGAFMLALGLSMIARKQVNLDRRLRVLEQQQ